MFEKLCSRFQEIKTIIRHTLMNVLFVPIAAQPSKITIKTG